MGGRRTATLAAAGALGALLACAGAAAVAAPPAGASDQVRALAVRIPATTAFMRLRGAPDAPLLRTPVPLHAVSPWLACAVVKAEDRAFFRHRAVDWGQSAKAAWRAASGGPPMGGSTLSQQLARNLWLTGERSLTRKLREAALARELERGLSKPRILEVYLNVAEWGPGVWGAEAASQHWLGKPARALDPFEAAFLSSLLPAPRAPLSGVNAERAWRTQRRVLDQMYRAGMLDDAAWWRAVARSDALAAALRSGTPVRKALRAGAEPGPRLLAPPPRGAGPVLPPSAALALGCGLERELAGERTRTRRPR